ncbi:permease-like cell division protein FtsX [Spiractinospora alimapuensis]|uniref:permease-like cell division protein FtsX n=1 Tax=Spiractinospora alimapuensis TaxID=2820884 RepID=UPI001EEBC7C1|nr:permease-like cell division protein FtsX [Spiractinospora alimapuensis]QVQ54336.1 permease-like cell division protein FtsX [Spiractinospora alimapuensis]
MRAQFVLSEIWIGLRRNLTMTIAVIITVAISLSLFGTGLLINQQVNEMRRFWDERIQMTVFLCTESSTTSVCQEEGAATDEDRQAIEDELRSMPEVTDVRYVPLDEAYADFEERFAGDEALVEATEEGDIPDNFRVSVRDSGEVDGVSDRIASMDGIDSISDDQAVLDQFFELLDGLKWGALTVAFVQLAAAALLIGNTIRLSAYSRRRETGIMRLVGASNFYIQLPFLLEGVVAGLLGGFIASAFIVGAKFTLLDRVQSWFQFDITLGLGSVFYVIGVTIILGVLICLVASFITLRRYLKV